MEIKSAHWWDGEVAPEAKAEVAAKAKAEAAAQPAAKACSFSFETSCRCGEGEQHVDAARRRRRAHRLKEAAAAAAACEQLSPRHANGRDADLGYIGLQGGYVHRVARGECILPAAAPLLTYYDC